MQDSLIGRTIGKYQIQEYIGRGGMAVVYKAYQPTLDRHVAIKLMHSFLAEEESFLGRFRREAKAVANLRHPNIVQIYDFDVTDGVYYYMVMEFVDGYTLKSKLEELAAQGELMPLDETLRIAQEVTAALSYAHKHGMIHRDIKPSNVMVNQEQEVILADFGIAKIVDNPQYTATGAMIGTPSYISPEQGLGEAGDVRSDLYSLGIMLFQMVTGQLPYDAETAMAVVLQHINDPLPLPSRINPALPPDLERIILKAIAKNPDDRFQTADEFSKHLRQARASLIPTDDSTIPFITAVPSEQPSVAVFSDSPSPMPQPVSSVTDVIQLPPYTLSPHHVAAEPTDLPAICDANWDRAVTHFSKGYIAQWLREGVSRLRAAHQHSLADELELLAARADAIVRRVQKADDISRNTGLEEFLQLLGAPPPILQITPDRLIIPDVGVGQTGQPVTFTVANAGRGYLVGRVVCLVSWLQTTNKRFGCAAGQQHTITVRPDLSRLPAGRIHSESGLLIRTTGDEQTLPVQVDVLPAALQLNILTLDFGQVGQGEIAQATFSIRNSGQGNLKGRILCRVPWLKAYPEQFRVSADQDCEITVTVDSQALSPGETTQSWALFIKSNGGHNVLGVQLDILPPQLKVEPVSVDLGTMDLAEPKNKTRAELTISNTGHGVLTGAVTSEIGWLNIEPPAFRCRPG